MVGKTILIVDSDAASRSFVSRTLRQQQYTVVQVASGKEGLIIAWRDRPDLIIVEPLLPDLSGQQLAAKLRHDPRTARVPLVALSLDNKNSSREACLDAGFNEYIVKSGDAVRYLVETVNKLLGDVPEPVVAEPPRSHDGMTFAFISAKGGIGTSSLCANLAMNVAESQPNSSVAVLDLVLPIGSLAAITGYKGTRNLVTLADLDPGQMTSQQLSEHMFEAGAWRFDLLPGSPDPESAAHLQVDKMGAIVEQLRGAYDYVLMDMGRSISSRFTLPLILHSNLVVLIVSTDLSSVAISKTMLDYLRQKGVKPESIFTILNRAVGLEGLTRAEAEKALGIEIKATFPYLVHFTLANNQNQPFVVKYPGDNSTVIAFKDVSARLVDTARQLRSARSKDDIRV